MKKRLSQSEEFQVMLIVLDKFLLLGVGVMAFGLYQMFKEPFLVGLSWIIIGVIVLLLLLWIIVKEFEIIR